MRAARLMLYFVVGLLLGAVSVLSYAETIPATASTAEPTTFYYLGAQGYTAVGDTPAETCTAAVAGGYLSANLAHCYFPNGAYLGSVTPYLQCSDQPYVAVGPGTVCSVFVCPVGQNWSLQGESCSRPDCVSPDVRDVSTGLCVPPPDKVCYSVVVSNTGSCIKPTPCVDGQLPADLTNTQPICADAKPSSECPPGGVVIGRTASGKALCISPPPKDENCAELGGTVVGTLNGDPVCNKEDLPLCADGSTALGTSNGQPVCKDSCPTGQASGTVNGVTTCYPVGPVTDKVTDQTGDTQPTTETTETTGPGGTTSETTTGEKNTTCTGDRCVTKTVTADGEGNTTTSEKSETKNDFCEANPTSLLCKGADSDCEEGSTLLRCLELGETTDQGEISEKEVGDSSVTPVTLGAAGSCPADVQLPRGAVLSWQPSCDMAIALRPIIIALGWLAAGYILMGGFVKQG